MLKTHSETNNINHQPIKTNVINPNNPLADQLAHKITTTMHLVILEMEICQYIFLL